MKRAILDEEEYTYLFSSGNTLTSFILATNTINID